MTTPDLHRPEKRLYQDADRIATRSVTAVDARQRPLDRSGGPRGVVARAFRRSTTRLTGPTTDRPTERA